MKRRRSRHAAATLAAVILVVSIAPCARAQSGAKALFYGASGAMLQSNAPASGPTMSRPGAPPSSLATGFPSAPAMPGMPPPPPTMPAMTPPPAPPDMSATPPPPMPGGAMPPATGPSPADELARMVEQLSASEGQPAAPPGFTAGAGTKDLVLVDAPRTGVRYWVELVDDKGARRQVTTEHVFRAGDRIKLHVTSNRDGYLTLANIGSTGRTTVLFPVAGAGNLVKAGADYAVPPGGYLRFDANPGQETLLLTFSTDPGGAPSPTAALAMARGAKDLVTEVDASSPQPATYAVAPSRPANGPGTFAIQIKLTHQ